jgi:DnaK suppressor protein
MWPTTNGNHSGTAKGQYRAVLERKKTQLENLLHRRDGITIEKSPDQSDEIQFAYERDLALRNLDRESNVLREVNAALRRVEGDEFGTCLRCERTIETKRLAALPWASCCLRCQVVTDQDGSGDPNDEPVFDGV